MPTPRTTRHAPLRTVGSDPLSISIYRTMERVSISMHVHAASEHAPWLLQPVVLLSYSDVGPSGRRSVAVHVQGLNDPRSSPVVAVATCCHGLRQPRLSDGWATEIHAGCSTATAVLCMACTATSRLSTRSSARLLAASLARSRSTCSVTCSWRVRVRVVGS